MEGARRRMPARFLLRAACGVRRRVRRAALRGVVRRAGSCGVRRTAYGGHMGRGELGWDAIAR